MVAKKKLPAHGHLGMFAARTAKQVDEMIKEIYEIPKGTKISKTFMYSDPPFKIYDCEAISPRKK